MIKFCLLKLERWEDVIDFAERVLPLTNYCEAISIVNKEHAKKKLGWKLNKKQLERVLSIRGNKLTLAAAHHLLGEDDKAIELLDKEFRKDKSLPYLIRDWVVFEGMERLPRYRRIVGLIDEAAAASE